MIIKNQSQGDFMYTVLEIIVIIVCFSIIMSQMFRLMLKNMHRKLEHIKCNQEKSEKRIDHLYQICVEMLGTRHRN